MNPCDERLLVPQRHRLLVALADAHATHVDLFLENEPPFDDDDLLDDRNDREVALGADVGHPVDHATDRNMLDVHMVVRERRIDQLLTLAGHGFDPHRVAGDLPTSYPEGFIMQEQ